MNYKLEDLIDISLLQSLQEKLNVIYSFPSAIIDNDGKVLTAVAWQDICTKFHRTNPDCEKECIKSDQYILEHLHEANPAVSYECPHGLVDNATPIIIEGKHLGNFFTGQFFLKKPDLEFFKNQAKKYGFDEKEYLEAVEKVPIWTKKKLAQYLDFIKGFIEIIAGIGLNNLREKESNRLIEETEERNLAIIRSTSDWIWEVDMDGKYTYCSEKVEQILGYTPDEIIGKTPFDLMLHDERKRVGAIFQNIVETKSSIINMENWNLHKDGHRVCLLTNGFPVFDESGKIIGYRGADKDITERKQAEETIKKSEEEFRSLAESMPQIVWITRADGWNIYFNQQWVDYTGLTLDESYGHGWNIPFHPDDRQGAWDAWQNAVNNNAEYSLECRLRKTDGSYRWWLVRGVPVVDANNEILKWFGTCTDIEEIKQTEDNLKKSEELFSLFMHHSPIYTYIKEVSPTESRVIQASDNFKEMIGSTATEMIGKTMDKLFPPEFAAKITEDDWSVVSNGKVLQLDEDLNGRNYTTIKFPIKHGDKNLLAGYTIDITERKLAEEKVREKDIEFRKLSANVPDLIFQFTRKADGSYCVPIASEGIKNIFGCSPEDVLDDFTPITNVIYPEDAERVIHDIEYSAEHLTYFTCEFRVHIPGKDIQWILSRSTPEKLADGSITWYGFNVDITEQKKAEKALKDSEDRFRDLVEMLPVAVFEMDTNFKITYANQHAFDLFGYNEDDFSKGLSGLDMLVPEDRERTIANFKMRLKGENPGLVEYHGLRKDGSILNIFFQANSILKDGKLFGIRGIIADITTLKNVEQSLRESEEKFSSIVQSSPMGMHLYSLEANGKLIFTGANPAADILLGVDNSKFIGKTIEEAFPPLANTEIPNAYREVASTGKSWQTEQITYDDKKISGAFEVHAVQTLPEKMLALFMDVTERKKAEQELQTSQAQLSNAMEIAKLGYWEYDVDEDMFTFNDHFYNIFRTTADKVGAYKMSAKDYAEKFLHPDDISLVVSETKKAIETTDPNYSRQIEHRIIYADGEIGYISVRFFITKDSDGRTIKTYGANQDITERKIAEIELQQSEEKFKRLFESLGDSVYVTKIGGADRGQILEVNSAAIRQTYYSREELLEMNIINDITVVGSSEISTDDWDEKLSNGNAVTTIEKKRRKDGSEFWTEVIVTPFDFKGEKASLSINHDITLRKLADEKLKESETKFRSISEQITDVIFLTNAKGVINYISPAVTNIFGYLPEEMEGKLFKVFLSKPDITKAMDAFKKSVMAGFPVLNISVILFIAISLSSG
ncbi:PAS domain S-box protein [Bacteroidota bacterium]